ncbi:MAG TPA: hypothetical protein VK689_03880, partial [Armatimonadota bacterium]|nr:hypothetical protein [Armatimonadota bacterium]
LQKQLAAPRLLIIDELGYVPLSPPLCQTSCRVFRTAERGGAGDREWHDTECAGRPARSRWCKSTTMKE